MGMNESKKIKLDGNEYEISLESSDEKGTLDDEAMQQYLNKAKYATCQIIFKKSYGSGFFCKIPYTKIKMCY